MLSLILSSWLALANTPVEPEAPAAAIATEAAPLDAEAIALAAEFAAFEASLTWQQGDIALGDDLATIHVPEGYRFLGPVDADRMLVAWGNPGGQEPLGMLFPAGVSPFANDSWGILLQYEADGHVDDEDAATVDYTELLGTLQSDAEAANPSREAEGFAPVHIVGWAEPPSYDSATRKIYWAKELDFGEEPHTLNYDVRVLGREGVLAMSAIASMTQLPQIRGDMAQVITFVEFDAGNRYTDFDPSSDNKAAYGIAGLVAGGAIAAKTGLLKGLFLALLAGKKFVVFGLIAMVGAVKAFLGRKEPS